MHASLSGLVLAGAILGANANPAPYGWMEQYGAAKRDTTFPAAVSPECVDFVIGSDSASSGTASGQVCLSVDPATHSLTVTYPRNSNGLLYTDAQVWVGCSAPTGGSSDNSNAPGKYPFTLSNGACKLLGGGTTATCTFKIDTILAGCKGCDKSFNIVAHAGVGGQTGAGKGKNFGNSWHRMYWTPSLYCLCTQTYTFDPSTFYQTLESTTTITEVSTTSYTTTSTSVFVTTSTSIYDTTDYSTTIFPSTSTTTETSISTPPTSYSTLTCR